MKEKMINKVFNLMLPLLVILAMTAFLISQIARFEAYAADITEEAVVVEELQEAETVKPTTKIDEPEELLDNYIEIISEETAKKYNSISYEAKNGIIPSKLRGNKLSGAEKKLYDLLKIEIEKVAEGKNQDGLTEFTIPFAKLYPAELFDKPYSAGELGVENIVEDGAITEEAKNAVAAKFNLDFKKVLNALLYDCPYSLFWFNKTVGMDIETYCVVGAEGDGEIFYAHCESYVIDENNKKHESAYKLYLAVSDEFASKESCAAHVFEDKVKPVQTDTEKIKSLNKAVTNAMNVVNGAKGKSTTYEKLDYYREWICKEVSYNYGAAKEHDTHYGNPWQLIYAFDGDPNTNIVCEGYSKAFKYLCDLTDNLGADCQLVSGEMSGAGFDPGPHMWNIVGIDGKNYLVDVTNCDGATGDPRRLFMVGSATKKVKLPEGVYAESYEFKVNPTLTFTYDYETLSLFDESERLLASENYVSENQSTNNQGTNSNTNTNTGTKKEDEPKPAKIDISKEISFGSVPDCTYTGSAITPKLTIPGFVQDKDYTVSFEHNTNVGDAKVIISGIGDYTGTVTDTFKIVAKPIESLNVVFSPSSYTYNGKVKTPVVVVKDGTKTLKKGIDYTVSYAGGRKEIGTYKVTVRMKGNYSGSKGLNFVINPKGTSISTPKAAKKAVTVKWKKQTAKMSGKKQIAGYQVQVSPVRNFKSGIKTKNVKGAKKTSVKVSGLKTKTVYYVRVRTYFKVGSKTFYSNWSSVNSVKVK